jgi:anti-sigma factor RsiW
MKHEYYQELLHLSLYGDLEEDEERCLDEHVQTCSDCSTELAELKKLNAVLRQRSQVEVTDQLLDEARRELRVALRIAESKRFSLAEWIERFTFFPMPSVRLAAVSGATLVIGLSLGYLAFHPGEDSQLSGVMPAVGSSMVERTEPRVSGFRFLQQPQENGDVEIAFDLVTPVRLKGNVADNAVQRVLAQALMNEQNPGARIRTVSALAAQVDASLRPDEEVKAALIQALKSDGNVGVRREALKALRKLPIDKVIKDALLYLLTHDRNPGIRVEAINYLDQSVLTDEVRDPDILKVLQERMQKDENNYVRIRAKNVYEEAQQ